MDEAPFDDPKVRQAVNHAIDIDSIIKNIVGPTGIRAHNTTVPPYMRGNASNLLDPLPFDPEKARRLLAEAGFPNGFKTKLTIVAENGVAEAEAIKIQEDLDAINIEVEIVRLPYAEYVSLETVENYEGMLWVFWASDFPDAAGLLQPHFHSRNILVSNLAYYANPEVDALLDESEGELNDEQRNRLLIEVQKLVAADQPYIFIDHFNWFLPMSTHLTGYKLTPMWMWDCFSRNLRPA
jgi:ABC-type transport system substrate-binding protein